VPEAQFEATRLPYADYDEYMAHLDRVLDAYKWACLCADQPSAVQAECASRRDYLSTILDPTQRAEGDERVRQWKLALARETAHS
jgi:hypothetical protein